MALREGSVEEEGVYRQREEVSFEIVRILTYGKYVESLSHGMTAGLIVPVKVATGLRLGWHLFGQND